MGVSLSGFVIIFIVFVDSSVSVGRGFGFFGDFFGGSDWSGSWDRLLLLMLLVLLLLIFFIFSLWLAGRGHDRKTRPSEFSRLSRDLLGVLVE